jgi:hypothetical protein
MHELVCFGHIIVITYLYVKYCGKKYQELFLKLKFFIVQVNHMLKYYGQILLQRSFHNYFQQKKLFCFRAFLSEYYLP